MVRKKKNKIASSESNEGSATASKDLCFQKQVVAPLKPNIFGEVFIIGRSLITIFQMDSEEGLVSQLLGDGGGQNFFVDVLVLLNPEDLNACRQVSDISKRQNTFFSFQIYGQEVKTIVM